MAGGDGNVTSGGGVATATWIEKGAVNWGSPPRRTGKPYEGAKLDRRETKLMYSLRRQGIETRINIPSAIS